MNEPDMQFALNMEYIKAAIRVAAIARQFSWTTDEDPICGMTFEQGALWDDLTTAISVLEEMETVA